jgi:hypothetical protein
MSVARYEKPEAEHAFVGTWHIYDMELWDESYFNMEVQAYVEVRPNSFGTFQFGLVSGYLDGEVESGGERFAFTWEGQDEMEPMTGSGWIELKREDTVVGSIKLHLADRSGFRARRVG